MKKKTPRFQGRYIEILMAFVDSDEEQCLANAADLGREMVQSKMPPEEIAEIHENALKHLSRKFPDKTLVESVSRISTPLIELLVSYGLAFRKWQEDLRKGEEERRKLEEQVQQALRLESLGILAGGIAHDFNNLLAMIMGNVGYLKSKRNIEGEVENVLQKVEDACHRAAAMTQQLLTFSKGGTPIKEVSSLSDLMEKSVTFCLTGSNTRCEFDFADDLWAADIDPGQINQVINNLIINAMQAMPEGGIIIVQVSNFSGKAPDIYGFEDGDYIRFTVKDFGTGISKKHIKQIFDPYFTTKQKGSGLGLAISYSIIKNHGGHIDVESEPGRGTIFSVYLPATGKTPSVRDEKPPDEMKPPLLEGIRVLVLDDEETIREFTCMVLDGLGCEVHLASDGQEAVSMFRKAHDSGEPFDVAILDLTVPGGTGGKEAIVSMLEIDPSLKAIVSSGYSNDPVLASHEEYGFMGKLAKPYSVEQLKAMMTELIDN